MSDVQKQFKTTDRIKEELGQRADRTEKERSNEKLESTTNTSDELFKPIFKTKLQDVEVIEMSAARFDAVVKGIW